MEPEVADDCAELARDIVAVVGRELTSKGCDCVLFSGGIDTSLVALSAVTAGLRPRLITVTYPGSADEEYALYVAERLGLEIHLVRPPTELSMKCVDEALHAMETIDPIEVISAAAVCAGLLKAKELGCRCVATGDGGDELFIGYDFLLDRSLKELSKWLNRVTTEAFFNSLAMGSRLGVNVALPLYTDDVKDLARRSLEGCSVRERGGRKYGKYVLRLALETHSLDKVAWRPKDPITRGSGVQALLNLMKEKVTLQEAINLSEATMIRVPSYPHVYLLKRRLELGLSIPPREASNKRCPVCGRPMRGDHCKFCGAYVEEGEISVYNDELFKVTGQLRQT